MFYMLQSCARCCLDLTEVGPFVRKQHVRRSQLQHNIEHGTCGTFVGSRRIAGAPFNTQQETSVEAPSEMTHLPNELWLHILCFCSARDQWLGLRMATHQLKACVEQHFEREILPSIDVSMPVALPTYDARNPLRGKAIFQPVSPRTGRDAERMHLVLTSTDPDYYQDHFLGRWSGMRDTTDGTLSHSVRWDVSLGDKANRMRLRDAKAESTPSEGEVSASFEWKGTMTALFRS